MRIVGRLMCGSGRLIAILITGHRNRLRRGASRRHARCIEGSARKRRVPVVIVAPVCDVVAPLSNATRVPPTLHGISRVSIGRDHIVDPRCIEKLRVVSGVEAWHPPGELVALGGIALRRVALIATGSWL